MALHTQRSPRNLYQRLNSANKLSSSASLSGAPTLYVAALKHLEWSHHDLGRYSEMLQVQQTATT